MSIAIYNYLSSKASFSHMQIPSETVETTYNYNVGTNQIYITPKYKLHEKTNKSTLTAFVLINSS